MKLRHALSTAAAALLIAVPVASAHITLKSDNTSAGGYAYANFTVPHGCEGSSTTKVELKVPDGITSFVPQRSPLWDVKVTTKKPDGDLKNAHGEAITEVPDTVTWTYSTPLPNAQLDQLGASIALPTEEGQLNFPLVQTCEKGSTSWTEIQAEGGDEPEHPAPSLMITAASDGGHGDAADKDEEHAAGSDSGSENVSSKDVDNLQDDVDQARMIAIIGIVIGALGLLFGLFGMGRRKR